MGSARHSAADKPCRTDDCGAAASRPKLGPARCLAGEAHGGLIALLGWAGIAAGCASPDLGLARGAACAAGG